MSGYKKQIQQSPLPLAAQGPDRDGVTPLMHAAENGNARVIRQLVADGADVNDADKKGWTALMYAVRHGQLKAAAELITVGADIDAEARNGWTALSLAVKAGSPLIISLLANAAGKADTIAKLQ